MRTGIGCFLVLSASLTATGQMINDAERQNDRWSLHGQITTVVQGHGAFSSLYTGRNSLSPDAEIKSSLTSTLFAGVRLWDGAELFCNPELVGGEGVSSTLGIAAFPNGEIFRVGDPGAKLGISRLFFRYTIGNGGGRKESSSDVNELGGVYDARRLRITIGKFSVVDYVDDNKYSHDARTQFLNWALMDNGAWDYPADTRGYTWGAVTEYIDPWWALRSYAVMVPAEANGMRMDPMVSRANAEALELEYHTTFRARAGSVRIAGYLNHANMGSYAEAVVAGAASPDVVSTRHYGSTKSGVCLSLEQEMGEGIGIFLRLGWNDGRTETWAFTEIDRTASVGILLQGELWNRPKDAFGVATVLNGLANDHRQYLAAGGYGFLIGDGQLSYALESATEAFYQFPLFSPITATINYQLIIHPAYNSDRGPVSLGALRIHWEI